MKFDNVKAFEPFFEDRVAIEAKRPSMTIRGTFAACVFPAVDAEPVSDVSMETAASLIMILIAKRGEGAWNYEEAPRIGDKITLASGEKFAVTKVDKFVKEHFQLEAKEI